MRRWLEDGRIQIRFDMSQGLDQVLGAYAKLFSGANMGKVIVQLS
jgi:NADPH-dependent curcumin reductase CurA